VRQTFEESEFHQRKPLLRQTRSALRTYSCRCIASICRRVFAPTGNGEKSSAGRQHLRLRRSPDTPHCGDLKLQVMAADRLRSLRCAFKQTVITSWWILTPPGDQPPTLRLHAWPSGRTELRMPAVARRADGREQVVSLFRAAGGKVIINVSAAGQPRYSPARPKNF
jgi:hypothetical protein